MLNISNQAEVAYTILFLQLKIYPEWQLHSVISIEERLVAHSDHAVQICEAYIAKKSSFCLVSCLLRPLSIKIISQSKIIFI